MSSKPIISLAEARRLHGDNALWQNFARRLLHHPDIRQRLWQRQEGQCAHCGKPLHPERLTIHHLSYEHFCITERTDRVRGQRRRVPPCQNCDQSTACLEHLQALCRLCHRRRHRPETRE